MEEHTIIFEKSLNHGYIYSLYIDEKFQIRLNVSDGSATKKLEQLKRAGWSITKENGGKKMVCILRI